MSDLDDSLCSQSSRRRSWFDSDKPLTLHFAVDISDDHKDVTRKSAENETEEEEETLWLRHFTRPPRVDFGSVRVGATRTRRLRVANPLDHVQVVTLDRLPSRAGFALEPTRLSVDPGKSTSLTLTWTPEKEGSCRQLVLLHVDSVYRLQVVLLGTAVCQAHTKNGAKKTKHPFAVIQPVVKPPSSLPGEGHKKAAAVQVNRSVDRPIRRSQEATKRTKPRSHERENEPVISSLPVNSSESLIADLFNCKPGVSLTEDDFPDTPSKRATFIKNDPALPVTPVRRVTYKKVSAVMQNAPVVSPHAMDAVVEGVHSVTPVEKERCANECAQLIVDAKDSPVLNVTTERVPLLSCRQVVSSNGSDDAPLLVLSKVEEQMATDVSIVFEAERDVSQHCTKSSTTSASTTYYLDQCTDDSFSRHELSAQQSNNPIVIQQRLSSTPLVNTANLLPRFKSRVTDRTPSPIIGQRVARGTVVKKLAPVSADVLPSWAAAENNASSPSSSTPSSVGIQKRIVLRATSEMRPTCKQLFRPRPSPPGRPAPLAKRRSGVRFTANRSPTKRLSLGKTAKLKAGMHVGAASESIARTRSVRAKETCERNKSVNDASKMVRKKAMAPKIAQSRLVLISKPTRTAIPKHAMPFAAKNVYYDERWMEKEEHAFVRWLNFVLTPPDELMVDAKKPQKIDARSVFLGGPPPSAQPTRLAPDKETLSFRSYSTRRRLNRLRRAACGLFQSEPVARVIQKVEREIEQRRLLVRPDRMIHVDVGVKQNILNMLLCYNPLWLRIGLETVYGEMLMVQSNTDVIGLSHFMLTRLLANPDIAAQYAHPTVPHLFHQGYDVAIAQFTLKKFLLLVLLLDRAKTSRLIDHDPCLFCKDADIKSSREMLLLFSRDHLCGEGDVTRHLNHLGYKVCHKQLPTEEYDYAVANLATDLRDGIRLTRVIELQTTDYTLSKQLRAPAISKLQKVHNMGVVFKALTDRGVDVCTFKDDRVDPRDIVVGHRQKTLHVLWNIIFKFQVELVLSESQLRSEIRFLRQTNSVNNGMPLGCVTDLGLPRKHRRRSSEADIYFKSPRLSLLMKWCQAVCAPYMVKIDNLTVSFSDGRALCYLLHRYHPELIPRGAIRDRTSLTYQGELDMSVSSSGGDDSFSGCLTQAFSSVCMKSPLYEELLANEKANFKLLFEKVNELGGVPQMLNSADMSNTIPDEKVVITYITYLCARLLDIRHEVRAVRQIQTAWRRHRVRKEQAKQQRAVVVIQHAVRGFLQRQLASRVASAEGRNLTTDERSGHRSAMLQNVTSVIDPSSVLTQGDICGDDDVFVATFDNDAARPSTSDDDLLCYPGSCSTVDSSFQDCVESLDELYPAAAAGACLEDIAPSYLAETCSTDEVGSVFDHSAEKHSDLLTGSTVERIDESEYASAIKDEYIPSAELQIATTDDAIQGYGSSVNPITKSSSSSSSSSSNSTSSSVMNRSIHAASCVQAALKLQCLWRMALERRRRSQPTADEIGRKQQQAAVTLQRRWRATCVMKAEFSAFHVKRGAAITLQAWWRGMLERRGYLKKQTATICIQAWWRSNLERRQYMKTRRSALTVQSWWRYTLRIQSLRRQAAALVIQSCYRRYKEMCMYVRVKTACVVIQRWFRAQCENREYRAKRQAALIIQSWRRSVIVTQCQREKYLNARTAAVTIQTYFRKWQAMRMYARIRDACILIQRRFRDTCETRCVQIAYIVKQKSTLSIQSWWRSSCKGRSQRQQYLQTRQATVHIQIWWRSLCESYSQRQQYLQTRQATVHIQTWWRSLCESRCQRQQYLQTRQATVCIQIWWRSLCESRTQKQQYLQTRQATIDIQTWWKSLFESRTQRQQYLQTRQATTDIQTWWRSLCEARSQRQQYLQMRQATVHIQTWWRTLCEARSQRQEYLQMRKATFHIQTWWRSLCESHCQRQQYLQTRQATTRIQTWWRSLCESRTQRLVKQATVHIQTWWRTLCEARSQRQEYLQMRKATFHIQTWWRSLCEARCQRQKYLQMRRATVHIQTWWRSLCESRSQRQQYLQMRQATVLIKTWWRSLCESCSQRQQYLQTRQATVHIQTWWRSLCESRYQRQQYLQTRQATVHIQTWWRSLCESRCQRQQYLQTRQATVHIQTWWRSLCESLCQRQQYLQTRQATTRIQTWWRSICESRTQRQQYLQTRQATIDIQTWWKSLCEAHCQRQEYLLMRQATVHIQTLWISLCEARSIRQQYLQTRQATIDIQTWWKSLCEARSQRRQYLQMRQATFHIQTWWRSLCEARSQRQQYLQMRQATVHIQTWWRSLCEAHSHRQQYLQMRQATFYIQTWWRSLCEARSHRQQYLQMRQATFYIQTWWRSLCETRSQRQQYLQTRQATIHIQTFWRSLCESRCQRQQYLQMRQATTRIQTWWRSLCESRTQRQQYLQTRQATIDIQTWWRSLCEARSQRQQYLQMRKATFHIQTWWRSLCEACSHRQQYLQMRQAAFHIQTLWRSLCEARSQRQQYLQMRQATFHIQTWWRSLCESRCQRQQYLQTRQATTRIQTWWRSICESRTQRQQYLQTRQATIDIQTWWKSLCEDHCQRQEYLLMRQATVHIQTLWISLCEARSIRQQYLQTRQATIDIQTWWKSLCEARSQRRQYLQMRQATFHIQTWWRSLCEARSQRQQYLQMRQATVHIQTWWRSLCEAHSHRQQYLQMRQATFYIQTWWRSLCEARSHRQQYLQMRQATFYIQTWWRSLCETRSQRQQYLQTRQATIHIQTFWRSLCESRCQRQQYLQTRQATTRIQTWWRSLCESRTQRQQYLQTRQATIDIQTWWRSLCEARSQRQQYLQMRKATFHIQTWWRSLCEACSHRQQYLQMRQAAFHIQTLWRSLCEARSQRQQYLQMRQATFHIQTWWRSLCESRCQRQQYLQRRQATTRIQTWWRSLCESRTQRQQYLQTRQATIDIQTWWKSLCEARSQRRQYLQMRRATFHIQTWWRSLCESRYQKQQYLQKEQATVHIQTRWRSLCEARSQRQQYLQVKQATIHIQSWWRSLREACCQRQQYLQTRQATVHIQNWWRSFCESRSQRQQYLQARQAAIFLQRWWRFTHLCRQQRQSYQSLQRACVKVQSTYRGKMTRRCLQHQQLAASRIQSAYHSWRFKQELMRQNMAAVTIQTCYRRWRSQRAYLSQRTACVVIQRQFQALLARRELQRERTSAAIVLQTHFRRTIHAWSSRRCYLHTRFMVVRLQSAWRRWLIQRRLVYERRRCQAAVYIQSWLRGHRTRHDLQMARAESRQQVLVALRAQLAVLTIQKAFRQHMALQAARKQLGHVIRLQRWIRSRLYRVRFLRLRRGIRLIQRIARQQAARRNMAASRIQASVRDWLAQRRQCRRERAAVVLQSYWRARSVRASMKSKRLRAACERAREAARNANAHLTLGQRTSSALDYLLRYKQLSYIREAVINLDVVSRLSALCCERIVEWNAVCVLLRLIRSCNRSLPHIEIVSYTVNILLNLAKYEKTVAAVFEGENSLDVMVDLVTVYREKADVFPKTCMLIGLLASDPLRQIEMLRHPHLLDKLRACQRLTVRHRRQHHAGPPTMRGGDRVAASRSFSVSVLGDVSLLAASPRRRAIQPDWRLGTTDGYMVSDPLLAVRFALSCLERGMSK